jgi:protein-S-isoprenylcysteine O-methyltransferase Ste14
LVGFGTLEASVRRPGTASALERGESDAGTTATIVAAYVAAVTLPLVAGRARLPALPRSIAAVGVLTEGSGLALRAWSMATLDAAYSRTLRVEDQQTVIDAGPYRIVRHPGYLGSILVWSGFALTSRNLMSVLGVCLPLATAYARRIQVEEALLRRDLPGYAAYSTRTWRLIPFVW